MRQWAADCEYRCEPLTDDRTHIYMSLYNKNAGPTHGFWGSIALWHRFFRPSVVSCVVQLLEVTDSDNASKRVNDCATNVKDCRFAPYSAYFRRLPPLLKSVIKNAHKCMVFWRNTVFECH